MPLKMKLYFVLVANTVAFVFSSLPIIKLDGLNNNRFSIWFWKPIVLSSSFRRTKSFIRTTNAQRYCQTYWGPSALRGMHRYMPHWYHPSNIFVRPVGFPHWITIRLSWRTELLSWAYHVAHMRPTWVLSAPCWPHVGPMNNGGMRTNSWDIHGMANCIE